MQPMVVICIVVYTVVNSSMDAVQCIKYQSLWRCCNTSRAWSFVNVGFEINNGGVRDAKKINDVFHATSYSRRSPGVLIIIIVLHMWR